jgi:hypothetical protein
MSASHPKQTLAVRPLSPTQAPFSIVAIRRKGAGPNACPNSLMMD